MKQPTNKRGKSKKEAHSDANRSVSAREAPSKEKRVDIIVGLMADGMWVTGVTGKQLAAEWGLSPGTLEHDAAEASRSFRLTLNEDEKNARKARWLAKIESAQANARRLGRCEAEKGLLELEGKGLGFFEPERRELSGPEGTPLQPAVVVLPALEDEDDSGRETDSLVTEPRTAN